jgi:hypothetical protein
MSKHNKKRNIGIIYEQIIQFVCKSLMENNNDIAEQGLSIIKEHFKEGTQLNKEYKLFKALSDTKGVSEHLANSIIFEAKKACNHMFDNEKLEKEKSSLIRKLNYTFGRGVIFEESIKNYTEYATIQTLLNEWRNPETASFDLTTKYEIKLHESLSSSIKEEKSINDIPQVDSITYKLMNEIFNKKYSSLFNETQNRLLKLYSAEKNEELLESFSNLKTKTGILLEKYINNCNNKILKEKYQKVFNNISNLSDTEVSKENLQKYLTLSKLEEELIGEE